MSRGVPEMAAPRSFHVFIYDDPFPPSDGPTTVRLSSRLWSHLPSELMETILLRLPASSQARFQAVCKAWRRRLLSRRFRERSAAIAFSSGRYMAGFVQSDDQLDRDVQGPYKVHRLSLDFLPSHVRELRVPTHAEHVRERLIFKQGLIVMEKRVRTRYPDGEWHPTVEATRQTVELCVVNPVNQTWRALPALCVDDTAVPVVGVTVDDGIRSGAGPDFELSVRYLMYEEIKFTEKWERIKVGWVYSSVSNTWSQQMWHEMDDGVEEVEPPAYRAHDTHRVHGEVLLIPRRPNRCCEVWRSLDRAGEKRVLLSSLPDELLAKVRSRPATESALHPELLQWMRMEEEEEEGEEEGVGNRRGAKLDVDLDCSWLVGDVILITVNVGLFHKQVVAYHVVTGEWHIVLPDRCHREAAVADEEDYYRGPPYSWQKKLLQSGSGMQFLQPTPGLDCSLKASLRATS